MQLYGKNIYHIYKNIWPKNNTKNIERTYTHRSGAFSKASQLNIDISDILKQGFSKNGKRFSNYYKKTLCIMLLMMYTL